MPDFKNYGLMQKAALWSPYSTGTDLMTGPLGGPVGTPPFAPGQASAQSVQQKSQENGDQQAKSQSDFWDKTIIPGYYMGQMASAMGGGPAGGALAGAASSGLGMLYNYFANKYSQAPAGTVTDAYTPKPQDTPSSAQWAAYDAGSTPAGTRDV